MIASAIVFFKVGDTEFEGNGWLFAGVSILVSLAGSFLLHWGMVGIALSQVGLFGLVTVYNMYSGRKPWM
ncbi:MAG: hypothetical protein O3C21_03035 [Verrucomicrobia bacterium]|nr:hypothetical protein [Verrucomicrobiota bacterium]